MMDLKELFAQKGKLEWTLQITQAKLQQVNSELIKAYNEQKPEVVNDSNSMEPKSDSTL